MHASENLNVCVIGLGPVGIVSGVCYAKQGHNVAGVDIDAKRVTALMEGRSPVVEPQLDALIRQTRASSRFWATQHYREGLANSDVIMIAVGTPTPFGAPDLSQLESACAQVAELLREKDNRPVIAIRSTVPPGTIRTRLIPLIERISGKRAGRDFYMASNPEFLREGSAIADFFRTGRIIIGTDSPEAGKRLEMLYREVEAEQCLQVSIESAEFAKYVDNTWHALKVAFANEIGRVCQAFGGDPDETTEIFLSDHHLNISSVYLRPGFAFGGSCLPKDVRGLNHLAKTLGVTTPVVDAILPSNAEHIALGLNAILVHHPRKVGLLGVAFKEKVDDLRESPALAIAAELMENGIQVAAHDPAFHTGDSIPLANGKHLIIEDLETITFSTDTLVLMHNLPHYRTIAQRYASNGKHVVDLTGLPATETLARGKNFQSGNIENLVFG